MLRQYSDTARISMRNRRNTYDNVRSQTWWKIHQRPKYTTIKHWHRHTFSNIHNIISQSIFTKYSRKYFHPRKSIVFYPDDDIAHYEKVALYCPNSSRTVRILAENGRAAIALLRAKNGTKRQIKYTNRKFRIFALERTEKKKSIHHHYNFLSGLTRSVRILAYLRYIG